MSSFSLLFVRDDNATAIVNLTLGTMEPGKRMIVYAAHTGAWQFMINYDEMHDQWTASYRKANHLVQPGEKVSAIPCEKPPVLSNKKYVYYKTRAEAEGAAARKFIELQN